MVRYRIQQCRENGEPEPELFPSLSLRAIYFLSKGYPRKIVMLCSKILLAMLVKEKEKPTLTLVWNCAGETSISRVPGTRRGLYGTALLVFLIFGVLLLRILYFSTEFIQMFLQKGSKPRSGQQVGQQCLFIFERRCLVWDKAKCRLLCCFSRRLYQGKAEAVDLQFYANCVRSLLEKRE